jgi:hypothetical protein
MPLGSFSQAATRGSFDAVVELIYVILYVWHLDAQRWDHQQNISENYGHLSRFGELLLSPSMAPHDPAASDVE